MVLRTARRGRNSGSPFWGCSRYPACRGTRAASGETAKRPVYYSLSPRFLRLTRRSFFRSQALKITSLFLIALLGAILYFAASIVRNTSSLRPISVSIAVIDGDTIRSGGKVYRLVGFNTPEAGLGASCEQERTLATKATQRLSQLIAAGGLELEPVRCACQPGTEGTDRCNFGRSCAILKARGQDVGSALIAEGLAEQYACGPTSCPRRKNWCN
ncbi:thermonuclease family protein [Bradyrhizobium sp. AUGA SZCCT0169]|nr:thermonuclease family protein [Bradyrhizobium sp. AUGA SZCCT0169]